MENVEALGLFYMHYVIFIIILRIKNNNRYQTSLPTITKSTYFKWKFSQEGALAIQNSSP